MKRDIRFLVTNSCNYRCGFCHREGISNHRIYNELSTNDYLTLFSIYSKMENWNGVTISGGEPLLYPNIVDLCKKLYAADANITVVTNGYFLIDKMDLLKYIHRINVSIHSLNEEIYNEIVGTENSLHKVINGLKIARNIYPSLNIRLNITPTIDNWSDDMLREILDFSQKIQASVKFTELFPSTMSNCISIETILAKLHSLGYSEIYSETRAKHLCNEGHDVYVTQCTCSQAKTHQNPVLFCRETHDLYVDHSGFFSLCRIGEERIDFFEDLKENNTQILKLKIKLALHRISGDLCKKYLICENV